MEANTHRNLTSVPQAAPGQRGRAVVAAVGIDAYQHWPKLHNAVQDAAGFQQVLTDRFGFLAPFPALFDLDATKPRIMGLVDRLRDWLDEADELLWLCSS